MSGPSMVGAMLRELLISVVGVALGFLFLLFVGALWWWLT